MQKNFDTILDFTKLKDKCLFCQAPLHIRLINFVGFTHQDSLPIINSPLKDKRFTFYLNHTTENYDVKADGFIDAETNKLTLTLPDSNTPIVDRHIAIAAFLDLRTHIELYCTNKHCTNGYWLSSYPFGIDYPYDRIDEWKIAPLKLFLEGFRSGDLTVQNDWVRKETCIYSSNNETAEPIRTPLMDFEMMGAEKTLTRIDTYAVFG